MHLDRLLRVGGVEPASIGMPSFGDNLNPHSPHRRVRDVCYAIAAGLYIHFQFLVLLYRVFFDEFHVHAGVLHGNAFLSARHFNGNSRLYFARGRRSLGFGRRCRRILGGHSWGKRRTRSNADAPKKLCRESHKSLDSMVYGTAGRVKSRHVKFGCNLHSRCCPAGSAVETRGNGYLTDEYGSCKFSRICSAGNMGTLQEGYSPRAVSAGRQTDCFTIRNGIARRAQWVLPPTPFMSAKSPIPPLGPSSRRSIKRQRTSTKSWARTRATTTRERITRTAKPWNARLLNWKAGTVLMSFHRGWRESTRSSGCCAQAIMWFCPKRFTEAFSAFPRNSSSTLAWNSALWTPPCLISSGTPCVLIRKCSTSRRRPTPR